MAYGHQAIVDVKDHIGTQAITSLQGSLKISFTTNSLKGKVAIYNYSCVCLIACIRIYVASYSLINIAFAPIELDTGGVCMCIIIIMYAILLSKQLFPARKGRVIMYLWSNKVSFVPVWTSLQLVTGHKPLATGIIEWAQAYFFSGIGKSSPMVHITTMNTPWNSYVQMVTVMQMLLVEFHSERSQHRQKTHLNL